MSSIFRDIKATFAQTSLIDILYLVFLSSMIIFFLNINSDDPVSFLSNYPLALTSFFLILTTLFALWLSSRYSYLSLGPFLILILLIPYNYFYLHMNGITALGILGIMFLGSLVLNNILHNKNHKPYPAVLTISIVALTYAVYFSTISILRHINYQNASSFDVALYSQIQWNNIHGHFFHSSISGSNFVTHNSPFLILLSPFYAIHPAPETLLVLKTLFIASSTIPLYLILKNSVHDRSILPLTLGFLFFPFIVGQNFNAPHEMCFLPPLLLFCYYFFLKNHFKRFIFFLVLCLTVKEHMAMISIMFGLYAIYRKKERHWILIPLFLGLAWGIFSMWIIYHFQQIYHIDPYPAWLIDNIKRRLFRHDHSFISNLVWSLQTSNMGHWINFCFIYPLLSPVIFILPFFSSIWILGLPELIINLMATIPLTYPTWHYNIVISIFLFLACVGAIKNSLSWKFLGSLNLTPSQIQEYLSWLLCICILSHSFLWLDYLHIKKDPRYVSVMNTAIRLIPLSSSVSMTKHLVAYVSDRKDYFLCEDNRKGEYIVLDKNEGLEDCFKDITAAKNYALIFSKDRIRVFKNTLPNS